MNLPLPPASRRHSRARTSFSWSRYCISLLAIAPLVVLPPHAHANLPAGAQVVHGDVSIAQAGTRMTINQASRHAIVNWQSFNLGPENSLRLQQGGADAAMLARVTGGDASQLLGALQADGKLFLINPRGIVVGQGAVIDTASFIASTLDVSDAEWIAGGAMTFKGDSAAGIVNLGKITAREGDVMLFAHAVKNAGEISAAKGAAVLAAGSEVLLASPGDSSVVVKFNLPKSAATAQTGVENSGVIDAAQAELKAAGGSVYDLAINQSGVVRATGVDTRNGRILLTAEGGTAHVSGSATARNADGSGGEILVGGDYQGRNASVPNATRTVVTATAVLDASAPNAELQTPDAGPSRAAGRVIVWADDTTTFLGRLSAGGDNAGFAEISGKRFLDFRPASTFDLGVGGTLLLDPDALFIGATNPGTAASFLSVADLQSQLAASNVTLNTSTAAGDITFGSAVTWATAHSLTAKSGGSIHLNASLTGTHANSALVLRPGKEAIHASQGGLPIANPRARSTGGTTITVGTLSYGVNADAAPTGYTINGGTGGAEFAGNLNVGALELDLSAGSVGLETLGANNAIGAFRTTGAGDLGRVSVQDHSGNLDVRLTSANSATNFVSVTTPGTLTLQSGSSLSFANPANVILASTAGAFVNQAGATPFGANARYLIYTSTPAATTRGGLAPTYVFNQAFNADDFFTTYGGDTTSRLIYSGGKATVTLTADNQTRVYGDADASPTFTATGLVDGDTFATSGITGAPALAHSATKLSHVGSHTITAATGTLGGTSFYNVAVAPGSLSITAAPLAIAVDAKSRTYGDANPTLTATFTGLKNDESAAAAGTLSLATAATPSSSAGSYAITGALSGANPNYTATITPGTLTIDKAPLTVSVSNSITKAQGAANPDFAAFTSAAGLKLSDTLATAVPNLAFNTAATTSSPDGAYAVAPTGASANYALTFHPGLLTISTVVLPALTYRANDATRVYGDANPAFGFTRTGLVTGTPDDVTGAPAFTTTATQSSGVGSYAIGISRGTLTSSNYRFTFVPGSLAVTPAPLTVAMSNASRTYGDANPSFSWNITGLKNSDPAAVAGTVTPTTSATPTSSVGSYAIGATLAGTSANYTATVTPGALTINRAPLVVNVNNASRAFGAAEPAFSANYVGFKNGETPAVLSGLTFASTATAASPVGTYPITASATSANYALTFNPGLLTISNALLTYTASDVSRVYGDANPAFGYTVSGLKPGDALATAVTGAPSLTTTATQSSGVGSYAIAIGQGTLAAANYGFAFVPGTLSVTPAPLVITPNSASRTYGDANPIFTATFNGLKNADTGGSISGLALTTSATAQSGAGTYAITASGASAANYAISYGAPGTLTVDKAPLTFDFSRPFSRYYGDPNENFTSALSWSGLKNSDTIFSILSGLTLGTSATATSGPGSYPITISGSHPNYAIVGGSGTLHVLPAPLTIAIDDQSRLYGDANPAFTYRVSGFRNGETTALLSGLNVGTTATAAANVGAHPITGAGASAGPNYAIVYQPGTLTVGPAPLTATIASATRTYGAANPVFSATLSGFKNGDTDAAISGLAFSTTATPASDVGTYPINGAITAASNYTVTFVPGTLTVDPAVLPLTPRADAAFVYGDTTAPRFSFNASGFVNGDTFAEINAFGIAYQHSVNASSPAGSYTVTMTGGSLPNYTVVRQPGTFVVQKAPLSVAIDHASRTYGAANPTFTATYAGLRNGDSAAAVAAGLSFFSPAIAGTPVGIYAIMGSGAAANYDLTFRNGALTINPATLTVTPTAVSGLTFGDAYPTLGYSVTGWAPGDASRALSGVTFAGLPSHAGSVVPGKHTLSIASAGAADGNYVTVAGAATTVSVDRKTVEIAGPTMKLPAGSAVPATVPVAMPELVPGGPEFTATSAIPATVVHSTIVTTGKIEIPVEIVPAEGTTRAEIEKFYDLKTKPGFFSALTDVVYLPADKMTIPSTFILDTGSLTIDPATLVIGDTGPVVRLKYGSRVSPEGPLTADNMVELLAKNGADFQELANNFLSASQFEVMSAAQRALLKDFAAGRIGAEELSRRMRTEPDVQIVMLQLFDRYAAKLIERGGPYDPIQGAMVAQLSASVQKLRLEVADKSKAAYATWTAQMEHRNSNSLAGATAMLMPDLVSAAYTETINAAIAGSAAGVALGTGAAVAMATSKAVAVALVGYAGAAQASKMAVAAVAAAQTAAAPVGITVAVAVALIVVASVAMKESERHQAEYDAVQAGAQQIRHAEIAGGKWSLDRFKPTSDKERSEVTLAMGSIFKTAFGN